MNRLRVTVVGAGVIGLSCAIRLREAGAKVSVVAAQLPPDTTSSVAAAVWHPYLAEPRARVLAWGRATYQEYQRLAREPASGVDFRPALELCNPGEVAPFWSEVVPELRPARADELPAGASAGRVLPAPVVDVSVHLDWLVARYRALGGGIEQRHVPHLDDLELSCDVIVNCAGLGARELAPDPLLHSIRGQVVVVRAPWITRCVFDDRVPQLPCYIVPRRASCVLGGSAHAGEESTVPDLQLAEDIVQRCTALEPSLARAVTLGHRVGLRPGRPSVRLEAEQRAGRLVIHDYGHGGSGYTLAWGCADEVVELVRNA